MTLEAESMCVVVYEDIGSVDCAGTCSYAISIYLCVVSVLCAECFVHSLSQGRRDTFLCPWKLFVCMCGFLLPSALEHPAIICMARNKTKWSEEGLNY